MLMSATLLLGPHELKLEMKQNEDGSMMPSTMWNSNQAGIPPSMQPGEPFARRIEQQQHIIEPA